MKKHLQYLPCYKCRNGVADSGAMIALSCCILLSSEMTGQH